MDPDEHEALDAVKAAVAERFPASDPFSWHSLCIDSQCYDCPLDDDVPNIDLNGQPLD